MKQRRKMLGGIFLSPFLARAKPNHAKGKPDNAAPSVAFISPSANATVSGTVTVAIAASDNVGIARVDLRVRGALVATFSAAPYSYAWNATPDGPATLTATAFDAAGNSGSASINVTVQNVVTPPPPAATTYYVSSSSGSDTNPGTQAAPWKTLAKVNAAKAAFKPGDSILLNRGEVWAETFNVTFLAGATGNPIIFGAYGSGALPTIDGQNAREYGINLNAASHVVMRDLRVINCTGDGVRLLAGSGNVADVLLQGMVAERNAGHGFSVEAALGTWDADALTHDTCTAQFNGQCGFHAYHVSNGTTGVWYRACVAAYNGQSVANHGFSAYVSNNIHFDNCEASFQDINPATGQPLYTNEGIGFCFDDFTKNSSLGNCRSHDNIIGAAVSHQGANNVTRNNTIQNNRSLGVVVNGGNSGSTNTTIQGNTIDRNGADGIAVWGPATGGLIDGNTITNNVGKAISYAGSVTGYVESNNTATGNGG